MSFNKKNSKNYMYTSITTTKMNKNRTTTKQNKMVYTDILIDSVYKKDNNKN